MDKNLAEIPGILTKSEMQILQLITENHSSRQIGSSLKIKEKTVENHRSNICKKLKITGQNALLIFALQHRSALQVHFKEK